MKKKSSGKKKKEREETERAGELWNWESLHGKGKRKNERMKEWESLLEGGGVGKRRGCGQNSVHMCGG